MARLQARGYNVAVYEPKMADAVAFIRDIDANMAPYVPTVRQYAPQVLAECETMAELRASDPMLHARTCVLFAILSPQCKFAANVRMTRRMVAALDNDFATADDVADVLSDFGRDNSLTVKPASKRIFASLDWLRALDETDMSLAALQEARKTRAVVGLGDKTMRMALALYDCTLPIYTLDVWMLRGIQGSYGGTVAASMSTNGAAYAAFETALVDWHQRTFPDLPVFVSQWALWNEWGFGQHMYHLAIFGIDA